MAHNLNSIKTQIDTITKNSNFGENIYNVVDNLLRITVAIKNTHGKSGWSTDLRNSNGELIFAPSDNIESALQPIIPLVLYLLGEVDTLPKQIGGADSTSIDKIRNGVIGSINSWNQKAESFARDSGILKMEKSSTDFHPFASFVAIPGIGPIVSQIPVSPRAAIFFAYLAFELTRIFVASPYPLARSVMSIMLAIIDLLRGDWKKAILSFAGYYSENSMMAGVYGKIFLSVYSMISPDIRDNIAYGIFDVAKSLIFGTILQVVQIFSPAPVRDVINQGFDELREMIIIPETEAISKETGLEDQILPQKKDYYRDLTYDDIQNIQSILRDKTRYCSQEFQGAVASLKKSPLIENLLQLIGIPTLDEDIERECGKEILDYANTLAKDRLAAAEEKYITKPVVSDITSSNTELKNTAETLPVATEIEKTDKPVEIITNQEEPINPQQGGSYRKLRRALIYQS